MVEPIQRRRPSALRRAQYRSFELSRAPEQVGRVALWRLRFDLSEEPDRSAQALLSDEERERLRGFRQRDDRVRFVACRATLRTLLAERLGSSPREVRVARGRHGKPELVGASALDFNLSHAHEIGLFALVEQGQVGVDVERVESLEIARLIAPHVLHEHECAELALHSAEPWEERVFRRWVLKEAALKACGVGLHVQPSSFKVATGGSDARFELTDGPFPIAGRKVRLDLVSAAAGYAAALVHVEERLS
jgi:4'-phosphopantetheinyl transferase